MDARSSPDVPCSARLVGGEEGADGDADHVLDARFGRRLAGVEQQRLKQGRLAGVKKLRGGDPAVVDSQHPGLDLILSIIPINDISLGTLPPERLKNASGLFNLMRNLGGAFGLAGLTTVLNDRTDLHLARLHEAVTWSRVPAMEALNNLTQRFQSFGSDAQAMALKQLMQITHRQGVVMAFSDVFLLLTFLFGCLAIAAILVRKPSAGAAAPAH